MMDKDSLVEPYALFKRAYMAKSEYDKKANWMFFYVYALTLFVYLLTILVVLLCR